MALRLPEKQLSNDAIQRKTPRDNTQMIMQAMGNNPYARAIDQITPVIANALQMRAQLRQQAQEAAAVSKSLESGVISSDVGDPNTMLKIYEAQTNRSKIRPDLPPIYLRPNKSGGFLDAITGEPVLEVDPNRKYQVLQGEGDQERISGNLEIRKQTRLDKNTQALSKRIEDLGVPEAITQFETLNRLIPKEGEIPGFGVVAGSFPSVMLSPEGRSIRQSVAALQNVKIKDRSGAAVTPPEFVRLKEEFGTGKLKTPEQLRQGLDQALMAYRERTRNALAGFDNETRREYLSRENVVDPLSILSSYGFGGIQTNQGIQQTGQGVQSAPVVGGTFNGSKVIGVRKIK